MTYNECFRVKNCIFSILMTNQNQKWNHKIEVRLVSIFQECNDTSWSPANCVPSIFSYCLPVTELCIRWLWECIVCHTLTARIYTEWGPVRLTTARRTIADACALPKKTVTKHGIFRFRPTQISFFAHRKWAKKWIFLLHFSYHGAFNFKEQILTLNVF